MTLKRMPLLDAASLQLEGKNMPIHIAGLMTFVYPESLSEDERKVFVSELVGRWREETRVAYPWNQVLTKPTRWQLRPLTREIYDLDLEYHLRQWSLPMPGGEKELGQMIAWIHELPMDLSKPLWECHFIEGLSDNRFALYVKIHHALVDGISGSALMVEALSTDKTSLSSPLWAASGAQSGPELEESGVRAARANFPSRSELKSAVGASITLRKKHKDLTTFSSAPRSILNGPISPHRRVATQHFELSRLKAMARATDATLNDIVMAITGGALRNYLLDANALPDESLTASMPVSTRKPGDTSVGNQVSMIFGSLGTNIADPEMRLEHVKSSTQAAKSKLQALPAKAVMAYTLLTVGPYLGSVVLGWAGDRKPIFNTVISNVPGQREARYLNGAELQHVYPVSVIMPGVPLNFTCVSHGEFLNFGIVACRDRVPHVQKLAVGLRSSLEELEHVLMNARSESWHRS